MTGAPPAGVSMVLADDEPLIRAGLRLVLEADPSLVVVGEAVDGDDALAVLRRTRPDVGLIDIRMPRCDGLEVIRRAARDPALAATRFLVLTTFADDAHLVEAVRAGAAGYLLKSMDPGDLRAAVRTTARGETSLAPVLVQRLLADYAGRRRPPDPRLARLTAREADVLREIAHGLSNVEIGRRLFVSEGTVKTHVAAILRKLEVRDRTQAAIAAHELGLVGPG